MKTAVRIKRVVLRRPAPSLVSTPRELTGVVELDLLGPRPESICPAQVRVTHPFGAEYDPDFLQVGPIVLGPGDRAAVEVLPSHAALSDVIRSWLTRALEQSIFGFGASGLSDMKDCTFERHCIYVLPAERSAHVAGF